MRKEGNYNELPVNNMQATETGAETESQAGIMTAFQYLKSLPRNLDRPALDSYKRDRESQIIDSEVAHDFTQSFRNTSNTFTIPISWTLTKSALLNLLGITDYEGYEGVNGIRFYAGINDDNQLTLIAVSTMAGTGCSDDLTVAEQYPYYDYADPCPNSCSSRGNLSMSNPTPLQVTILT